MILQVGCEGLSQRNKNINELLSRMVKEAGLFCKVELERDARYKSANDPNGTSSCMKTGLLYNDFWRCFFRKRQKLTCSQEWTCPLHLGDLYDSRLYE